MSEHCSKGSNLYNFVSTQRFALATERIANGSLTQSFNLRFFATHTGVAFKNTKSPITYAICH
jgi:hypothetical protein